MDRDFDVIGRYKAIGSKLKRYYAHNNFKNRIKQNNRQSENCSSVYCFVFYQNTKCLYSRLFSKLPAIVKVEFL